MLKTSDQIEQDFYDLVQAHALGKAIQGGIYRKGDRPISSNKEDLVVLFLSGSDRQIQSGTVLIHIYMPNNPPRANGRRYVDKERNQELLSLINDFIADSWKTEYKMEAETTPSVEDFQELEQGLIIARINYKRVADY